MRSRWVTVAGGCIMLLLGLFPKMAVLVKAPVGDNKGFRTAQFVRARLTWKSTDGFLVPVLAVSRLGGQSFVFVAEGNDEKSLTVKQRAIKVGDIIGSDYVVLDGIKAGDRVIVSGTQMLGDGAKVTPQK